MSTLHESFHLLQAGLKRLVLPIISLVVISIIGVTLLMFTAYQLDDYSLKTSKNLFENVFKKESEDLGKLVKDYSFWNEAVNKLVIELDPDFVNENLLGPYLADTFSISRVTVLNLDLTPVISVLDGNPEKQGLKTLVSSDMQIIAKRALSTDMLNPVAETGIIKLENSLHIVAISPITPHLETNNLDINKTYGLMVMTKQLNQHLLDQWASNYSFQNMRLSMQSSTVDKKEAEVPLLTPSSSWVGNISWSPNRPGTEYIRKALVWVGSLFGFMIAMTVLFVFRLKQQSQVANDTSKLFEDTHERLHKAAFYDPITSLPNRLFVTDRLEQAVISRDRMTTITAVLFIDLDGFKPVNDVHGHHVGDSLLSMVGQRLQACVRKLDTVSRIGGDEFVVILTDLPQAEDAKVAAIKINEELSRKFVLNGENIFISASVGIAIAPMDSKDPVQLLQYADSAMYQAKKNGKNSFAFFCKS